MDEMPWLKSYDPGMPATLHPYPECTILDELRDTTRERPDHTALIFRGRRISYAELDWLGDAFGAAL
jgi:long-chain acyl-CoA synthetase